MPDAGSFYAVTSPGGGYAIPITAPGTYHVAFSGGGMPASSGAPRSAASASSSTSRCPCRSPPGGARPRRCRAPRAARSPPASRRASGHVDRLHVHELADAPDAELAAVARLLDAAERAGAGRSARRRSRSSEPASSRRAAISSPRAASRVKTAAPRPKGESLATRIASSSSRHEEERRDGAEQLFVVGRHAGRDVGEHRRRVEGARARGPLAAEEAAARPSRRCARPARAPRRAGRARASGPDRRRRRPAGRPRAARRIALDEEPLGSASRCDVGDHEALGGDAALAGVR